MRYCGEYFDTETGSIYLRARYYSPVNGRFSTVDPIRDGLNWYAYCANNAIVNSDRTGLFDSVSANDVIMYFYYLTMRPVDWFKNETRKGNMDEVIAVGIGAEKDDKGIYHIKQDCWQKWMGYNDLYDFVFVNAVEYTGFSALLVKYPFSVGDEEFMIWGWKGNYINLGAGVEVGIYYGGEPHWQVDTNLAIPMELKLTHIDNGMIFYYAPNHDTWWITGFDPQTQDVNAEDLKVNCIMDFSSDPEMYESLKQTYANDESWGFYSNNIAVLTF